MDMLRTSSTGAQPLEAHATSSTADTNRNSLSMPITMSTASLPAQVRHPQEWLSDKPYVEIGGKKIWAGSQPYHQETGKGRETDALLTVNNYYGLPIYEPYPFRPVPSLDLRNIPALLAKARQDKLEPVSLDLSLPAELSAEIEQADTDMGSGKSKGISEELAGRIDARIKEALGDHVDAIGQGPVVLSCTDPKDPQTTVTWLIRADTSGTENGIWRAIRSESAAVNAQRSSQPVIGTSLSEALAYYLKNTETSALSLRYYSGGTKRFSLPSQAQPDQKKSVKTATPHGMLKLPHDVIDNGLALYLTPKDLRNLSLVNRQMRGATQQRLNAYTSAEHRINGRPDIELTNGLVKPGLENPLDSVGDRFSPAARPMTVRYVADLIRVIKSLPPEHRAEFINKLMDKAAPLFAGDAIGYRVHRTEGQVRIPAELQDLLTYDQFDIREIGLNFVEQDYRMSTRPLDLVHRELAIVFSELDGYRPQIRKELGKDQTPGAEDVTYPEPLKQLLRHPSPGMRAVADKIVSDFLAPHVSLPKSAVDTANGIAHFPLHEYEDGARKIHMDPAYGTWLSNKGWLGEYAIENFRCLYDCLVEQHSPRDATNILLPMIINGGVLTTMIEGRMRWLPYVTAETTRRLVPEILERIKTWEPARAEAVVQDLIRITNAFLYDAEPTLEMIYGFRELLPQEIIVLNERQKAFLDQLKAASLPFADHMAQRMLNQMENTWLLNKRLEDGFNEYIVEHARALVDRVNEKGILLDKNDWQQRDAELSDYINHVGGSTRLRYDLSDLLYFWGN